MTKKLAIPCWLLAMMLCIMVQSLPAQQRIRILFLLDASLSMRNEWPGGTKWNTASSALASIADSISKFDHVEIGLRVFGHLYPEPDKNCRDTRLEAPIDSNNIARIKKKLSEIRPKGITPLVYSIEKCAADFGEVNARNILIVITDGEEACEGDPCRAAFELQKNSIVLKPFVIGMALHATSIEKLNCMGSLFNTNSSEEFTVQLSRIVNEAIAKTTLQINLNDANNKPTETEANMSFYDAETGLLKYNFYHTLNAYGLPDTLVVSPLLKYKIQVHTIPPIVKENVELERNRHNIIDINAPQGYLNFTLQGIVPKTSVADRIKCLVHQPNETETLNVQKVNSKQKYLTGSYDLEVLTLPRTIVKGIKISQSKTTDVQIPAPGILTMNKSFELYGGIFSVEQNRMEKIYDLSLKDKQETLALQPGKYRLVYRAKNSRTIHTSVDKEFEIVSGGSLSLKL